MNRENGCLAILIDRIGPYHFSRLRTMGASIPTVAIETYGMDDVYQWDLVKGSDNFKRVTLFAGREAQARFGATLRQRVHAALEACQPAAVAVPGWADPAGLIALQWCMSRRIPAIMMSDSTEWDQSRNFWKEWIKGYLVRLASAGLVAGTPHAAYIQKLGMDSRRVFMGYDVVDNDHFEKGADEARQRDPELRTKHGLPKKYFLASARFVEKKNLIRLIRAYARYRDLARKSAGPDSDADAWDLVLLGDGPMRGAIDEQIAAFNLKQRVWLHGFKQYDELPIFYGLAKVFVHASTTEQWGLVVNEAMASGLPVMVSNRCGCAMDLVKESVTGFSFDPLNLEEMADMMFRFAAKPAELAKMGEAARKLMANWGCDRFMHGLLKARETAINAPLPKAPLLAPIIFKSLSYLHAG